MLIYLSVYITEMVKEEEAANLGWGLDMGCVGGRVEKGEIM